MLWTLVSRFSEVLWWSRVIRNTVPAVLELGGSLEGVRGDSTGLLKCFIAFVGGLDGAWFMSVQGKTMLATFIRTCTKSCT